MVRLGDQFGNTLGAVVAIRFAPAAQRLSAGFPLPHVPMKFKLAHPLVFETIGLLGSASLWAYTSTLDRRCVHYDRRYDPCHPWRASSAIYIFWHEYILSAITSRAHTQTSILVSGHRDGQYLTRVTQRLGFNVINGSSSKNGVSALKSFLHQSGKTSIGITPDGPRGPRRQLAPGPIFLASKLGIPVVCLGLGYDRPWRMNSWDRFAIPRPFSRIRAVFGPPFQIPKRLGKTGLEDWRLHVQEHLNSVTSVAEDWAASGERMEGEIPFQPPPFPARGLAKDFRIDIPAAIDRPSWETSEAA